MSITEKFTLDIKLGNSAMQTPHDVAEALRNVANKLDDVNGGERFDGFDDAGRIRDDNGNTVGSWETA